MCKRRKGTPQLDSSSTATNKFAFPLARFAVPKVLNSVQTEPPEDNAVKAACTTRVNSYQQTTRNVRATLFFYFHEINVN
jgi:hypothetical protein